MVGAKITDMKNRYPESDISVVREGPWTITYSARNAKVERTLHTVKITARTSIYLTGRGFRWTDDPEPPKYIQERTLRAVRARRRALGLPL